MALPQFPRSSKYDIAWLTENEMGPCSIWLAEFLFDALSVRPGIRVLDLGCGRAMSSIFIAKEYGLQVWAADLWIDPTDNLKRILEAEAGDSVFPVHTEAHALPFAKGFFDAIVSLDAYHYFGTNELYFSYISSFLRADGQIGIVVPGVKRELNADDAKALGPLWEADFYSFHGAQWWRSLWQHSEQAKVQVSDEMPNGHQVWLHWDKTLKEAGVLKRRGDVEILEADHGNFTFVRVVATKE